MTSLRIERCPRPRASIPDSRRRYLQRQRRWRFCFAGGWAHHPAQLPAAWHQRPAGDRRDDPAGARDRGGPHLPQPRPGRHLRRRRRLDPAVRARVRHTRVRADGAARDRADPAAADHRGGGGGDGPGGGRGNDAGTVPQPHGRPGHHRRVGGRGAGSGDRDRNGPLRALLPGAAALRLRGRRSRPRSWSTASPWSAGTSPWRRCCWQAWP